MAAPARAPPTPTLPYDLRPIDSRPGGNHPVDIERAEAISVFFAIAQVFGALGPAFYGALIGTGSVRTGLFVGYLIGAGIMLLGGIVEVLIGINAEGKSLEAITKPLTAVDDAAAPATA